MAIFKKKYVQQSSTEDMVVTNPRTKYTDVFDDCDFILAVEKNRMEGVPAHCYLVMHIHTWENGEGMKEKLTVVSPRYLKIASYPSTFDSLFELQGILDVYSFKDLDNLEGFRKEHGYEWGKR